MKFRGYRLHVILIACALVIAVGIGAREFVFGRHMNKVAAEEFTELPGVEAVELQSRGAVTDVVLRVGPVSDFPTLYTRAARMATERFGRDAMLIIEDNRDARLEAAYERIHLALYEGAATGRFVPMEQRVMELLTRWSAGSDGESGSGPVEARITVDDEAVFVELSSGDNRLYERIARLHPAGAAAVGGMWP